MDAFVENRRNKQFIPSNLCHGWNINLHVEHFPSRKLLNERRKEKIDRWTRNAIINFAAQNDIFHLKYADHRVIVDSNERNFLEFSPHFSTHSSQTIDSQNRDDKSQNYVTHISVIWSTDKNNTKRMSQTSSGIAWQSSRLKRDMSQLVCSIVLSV